MNQDDELIAAGGYTRGGCVWTSPWVEERSVGLEGRGEAAYIFPALCVVRGSISDCTFWELSHFNWPSEASKGGLVLISALAYSRDNPRCGLAFGLRVCGKQHSSFHTRRRPGRGTRGTDARRSRAREECRFVSESGASLGSLSQEEGRYPIYIVTPSFTGLHG